MKYVLLVIGIVVAIVVFTTDESTEKTRSLRIALGASESFPPHDPLTRFAATIEEKTGMEAKVYALSLLNYAETSGGLRDGLADIGFVVFPYFPAEFSELNLAANLSMLATAGNTASLPGAVMAGATMEYVLDHCPDCQQQLRASNQVYLANTSTGPYQMLCATPVSSAGDVKGLRLRTGAANWTRWAEAMGATPITMTGNDIYDALSQKLVDCTLTSATELVTTRLMDIVTDVTLGVPGGVFSGLAAANFNRDVWQSLSTDHRQVVIDASARLAAEAVARFATEDAAAIAAAEASGTVTFHEADASLLEASAALLADELAAVAQQSKDLGIENVDEKIATFGKLIDRWKTLTDGMTASDVEQLTALYQNEIFAKLDAASYGLN